MSAIKIKKGDTVKVIAGKDKDKEGKVLSVDKKNGKVVVEGVNMVTKHAKPSAANHPYKENRSSQTTTPEPSKPSTGNKRRSNCYYNGSHHGMPHTDYPVILFSILFWLLLTDEFSTNKSEIISNNLHK